MRHFRLFNKFKCHHARGDVFVRVFIPHRYKRNLSGDVYSLCGGIVQQVALPDVRLPLIGTWEVFDGDATLASDDKSRDETHDKHRPDAILRILKDPDCSTTSGVNYDLNGT